MNWEMPYTEAITSMNRITEDFADKMKNEIFLSVCGGCSFLIQGIKPMGANISFACPNCRGRIMQMLKPDWVPSFATDAISGDL